MSLDPAISANTPADVDKRLRFIFRVDAGPQVGLGHLQRALSLALAVRAIGGDAMFLTNHEPTAHRRVARYEFPWATLADEESWGQSDLGRVLRIAEDWECAAIVVDSNVSGEAYLAELRKAGVWTCIVTDTARGAFPCDLVVNGDTHADSLEYRSSAEDARFLLGPEYAILRPEFWSVPPHSPHKSVRHMLLTLGGADSKHLMPVLLKMLDEVPGEFDVTGVIGPFFDHVPEIEAAVAASTRSIHLVREPDHILDLMMGVDLAISSGGQTLYELACAGCPTVAIRVAEDQKAQVAAFAKAGSVWMVDGGRQDVLAAVRESIEALIGDRQARAIMSNAGQRLVDGKGSLRVASEIMKKGFSMDTLGASVRKEGHILRGIQYSLLPFREDDISERYVNWLNDPEVNQFLEVRFTHQTFKTARSYVLSFYGPVEKYIWGIFPNHDLRLIIGTITLQEINRNHGSGEIGLLIGDKSYWGKGAARGAMELVIEFAFDKLDLRRVTGGTYARNHAINFTLRQIGYTCEGKLRKAYVLRPGERECVDGYRWGLLAEEWNKRRNARFPDRQR